MKFIHTDSPDQGIVAMAELMSQALNSDRKVLWFLCGGSNIPISTSIMDEIRGAVAGAPLANLTIALTDERYGPIDHPDSNAKQLVDSGFDLGGLMTIFPLCGKSLEQTVSAYDQAVVTAMNEMETAGGLIIAQFGIGGDSHIAGILPHSPAVEDYNMVCGYEAGLFTRITLTPVALRRIPTAFAFVFGQSKKDAIGRLRDAQAPLVDEPCQILKEMKEVTIYSDTI